jgi:hypothetical protein
MSKNIIVVLLYHRHKLLDLVCFRFCPIDGASSRPYMFSQILHLILGTGVHGLGLMAKFVAQISTSHSILVPRMCALSQFLLHISCYLLAT